MTIEATITQQMIADAEDRVAEAASQGYAVFARAKADLAQIRDAYRVQQLGDSADEQVAVVGDTYRHRTALSGMGLRWDRVAKAWVGTRGQITDLPAGCDVVTRGAAAMRTMDWANSDL